MKKIFFLFSMLLLTFTLASCSESEQKIKVIDENGEEVEVVLTPTDDDDVVKSALLYASQAQYEDVQGLDLEINASVALTVDESKSLNGAVVGKFLVSEEGFNLDGSLNYAINGVEETDGSIQNHSANGSLKGYYDVTDPYVYVALNSNIDGVVENIKVKDLLENLLGQLNQGLPSSPAVPTMAYESIPGLGSTSDILANLDIPQLLYLYKLMMPNSSIAISSVDKSEFVIKAGVSVNDILKVVNGNNMYKLTKDVVVNIEVAFGIADGRFLRLSIASSDAGLLEIFNLLSSSDNAVDFSQATLDLSLTMQIGYEAVTLEKLTAEEKALYIAQS